MKLTTIGRMSQESLPNGPDRPPHDGGLQINTDAHIFDVNGKVIPTSTPPVRGRTASTAPTALAAATSPTAWSSARTPLRAIAVLYAANLRTAHTRQDGALGRKWVMRPAPNRSS